MEDKIQLMLQEQSHAIIATLRQQQPFQHIICHAFSADLRNIYFATEANSALSTNIEQQPFINLILDNRTGCVDDEVLEASLTATGFAHKLNALKARIAKAALLDRNQGLIKLLEKPLACFYSMQVHTYCFDNGMNEVTIFHPNQPIEKDVSPA